MSSRVIFEISDISNSNNNALSQQQLSMRSRSAGIGCFKVPTCKVRGVRTPSWLFHLE